MDIKIDAKTVVANEGGFEPHPESYTPRVFAAIIPHWPIAGKDEHNPSVYEILQNGQAIPWPCLPLLEGFDYWVLYVEHLADIDMHRAPKKAGFGPSTQKAIDDAHAALRYQQDPVPRLAFNSQFDEKYLMPRVPESVGGLLLDSVPQADGYSGTLSALPEDVTWIGEIDGKRYHGLGKPESGPLSHLPEGGH